MRLRKEKTKEPPRLGMCKRLKKRPLLMLLVCFIISHKAGECKEEILNV